MKTCLKKYILFYILSVFIVFLITAFTVIFSKYNVIEHDDALGIFYEKYWTFMEKAFFNTYKGKWIASFFLKMSASVIPIKLGIHPIIWMQTGGALIKGLFYCVFSFLLAKFLFIKNNKSILYPLTALFCYLFVEIQLLGLYQNELYCSFYSFTFNFIIYFIFWILFFKKYYENKSFDKMLYVISFLLGMSSELTAFASIISIFIIFIYDIINEKKLNKFLLIINFCMMSGGILYFFNPGFYSDFINKTNEGIFNTVKPTIKEVILDFASVFTFEYFLYLIIIITLTIVIVKNKRDEKKLTVQPVSMLIGGIVFYLLMAFVRDKNMGYLYIMHFDVLLNIKILFLTVIMLELGILLKEKQTKLYNILTLSALVFSLIILIFKTPKLHHDEKYYQDRYLDERILAFYAYRNEIPATYSGIGSYAVYSVYARRIYNKEFNKEEIILKDFQKLLDKNFVLECK